MTFRNIEAEQARMGISNQEMATYLSVSERTIRNWKSRKTKFQTDKLCMLCDLFGCSADYLLGRTVGNEAMLKSALDAANREMALLKEENTRLNQENFWLSNK